MLEGTFLLFQIMAVYCPHRVDTDMTESLDGTRGGLNNMSIRSNKKLVPHQPCDTSTTSEIKPTIACLNDGKEQKTESSSHT